MSNIELAAGEKSYYATVSGYGKYALRVTVIDISSTDVIDISVSNVGNVVNLLLGNNNAIVVSFQYCDLLEEWNIVSVSVDYANSGLIEFRIISEVTDGCNNNKLLLRGTEWSFGYFITDADGLPLIGETGINV